MFRCRIPVFTTLVIYCHSVSLELNNNYLTGSVDESVCSLDIGTIKADCLPDDGDVAVMCRCCTTCCFESSCKEMSGEA